MRVVGATNPPASAEGEWIIQYWGPWLDEQYPNPAAAGELRWFAVVEGKDVERDDGQPFDWKGETIVPRSRTFIPARLSDNPYLASTNYGSVLQGMPEPLRSQLLYGDFSIGLDDDPWQVLPTAWVRAAQGRWQADGHPTDEDGSPVPLSAMGVDVAMGGKDKTVLARRYKTWLAELEKHEGSSTPQGEQTAGLVLKALTEGGYANIDVIGVGGQVYGLCKAQTPNARAVVYSQPSFGKDKTGTLEFVNIRAQAYWSFREALDPTNPNPIALPPDRKLRADLTAPRFKMMVGGIQIESKDDVKKRLGRSTDCGDAAVLAFWDDPRALYAQAMGKPFDMPSSMPSATRSSMRSQLGRPGTWVGTPEEVSAWQELEQEWSKPGRRTEMELERMRRQERIWDGRRGGRRRVTR